MASFHPSKAHMPSPSLQLNPTPPLGPSHFSIDLDRSPLVDSDPIRIITIFKMATSMSENDFGEAPQLSKIFEDARAIQVELDDSSEPSNSKEFQVRSLQPFIFCFSLKYYCLRSLLPQLHSHAFPSAH